MAFPGVRRLARPYGDTIRWGKRSEHSSLHKTPTAGTSHIRPLALRTSHQLIACGAEALAARADNKGRSWGQSEYFNMQHPTFNPSNKKLPVHKSLLSVLRHNCGRAFNRLGT